MGHGAGIVVELGRLLRGAETHGHTATHPELGDRRTGRRTDLVREGDERACELAVRPRVADLCAEVRVYADEGNALRLCDLSRLGESFAGADRCAELAVDRPRHEVRVRVHLDARRDTEPYGLRPAPAVREPGEPLDVMRTIDDEATDARRESFGNLVVRLRVAVQLHPRYRKTRAPRGLQLSERRDAGVDALVGDDRADPDQGAGLDRIRHSDRSMAEEGVHVLAQARADRRGIVDVEGRAVPVGECLEIVSPDAHVPVATHGRSERPDRQLDHVIRSSAGDRRAATR